LELPQNRTRVVDFLYRRPFRHYNEVFINIFNSCLIFPCFRQLDYPFFSAHFE
ncbi:hypothetical protein T06_11791, partial [Trichinella sp. T6]